jgi:hypothetical protein
MTKEKYTSNKGGTTNYEPMHISILLLMIFSIILVTLWRPIQLRKSSFVAVLSALIYYDNTLFAFSIK